MDHHNTTAKGSAMDNRLNQVLHNVIDILEADNGTTFEEKKEQALSLLRSSRDNEPAPAAYLPETKAAICDRLQKKFWRTGDQVDAGLIVLRKESALDKDAYIEVQKTYSPIACMYESNTFRDDVWNNHTSEEVLTFSIDHCGKYIGYCGIKDIAQNLWEIVIELLPQWTKHGLGFVAVTTMLNEIQRRMKISDFRIRIAPENVASQHFFEHLGAVPACISEFALHDPSMIEAFENENLDRITDQLTAVAQKFSVEPRKLLSHVLEYRLHWKEKRL